MRLLIIFVFADVDEVGEIHPLDKMVGGAERSACLKIYLSILTEETMN